MPTLTKYTSSPIPTEALREEFARADIEFEDVDHSGSTYEALVYLNNDAATADTEPSLENGYAGSYYIFGHGGCYGDRGHCDVKTRGPFDPRAPHGLQPTQKVVVATDAIRRAAAASEEMTITVIPILMSTTEQVPEDEIVPQFGTLSVTTYL